MAAAAAFSVAAAPLKPSSSSPSKTHKFHSSSFFHIPNTKPSYSCCSRLNAVPNPFMSSLTPLSLPSQEWGWGVGSQTAQDEDGAPTRGAAAGGGGDVMGLLLQERIVYLANPIDDFVADAIICQLLLLDAQDPTRDIRFFINSEGGSVSAAMAIYDIVQLVRADVSTIAIGFSGYTATLVLAGGTKGKRLAMPNTRIMIHQPLGGASGQASDVVVQADEIMHNKRNMARIVAGITGRKVEQVEQDIDREKYMGPLEALDYGIIDDVIDRDSMIPLKTFRGRPASKYNYDKIGEDPKKYLTPEIPDDDIF